MKKTILMTVAVVCISGIVNAQTYTYTSTSGNRQANNSNSSSVAGTYTFTSSAPLPGMGSPILNNAIEVTGGTGFVGQAGGATAGGLTWFYNPGPAGGADLSITNLSVPSAPAGYSIASFSMTFGQGSPGQASFGYTGSLNNSVGNGSFSGQSATDTTYTWFGGVPGAGQLTFDVSPFGANSYYEIKSTEVVYTTVPEPSSTALLGLGALGLLTRRKR